MSVPYEPDQLLTMEELVEILATSIDTLYKWSRRGAPHFPRCIRHPNRQIRVRGRDLDKWLEGRRS